MIVTLKSSYGQPQGSLTEAQIETLNPLFEQVHNDADYFVQKVKKQNPRKRPFVYMNEIQTCVKKESSSAYPSEHATLAKLYSDILSDFFPTEKAKFDARTVEIGRHRVLAVVHHPSDVEAGLKLADIIYAELKKSKKYQSMFEERMSKLRANQPI